MRARSPRPGGQTRDITRMDGAIANVGRIGRHGDGTMKCQVLGDAKFVVVLRVRWWC